MQIEVSASEIKSEKKADDRGRVTLGSEYAASTVTVAVLEVKDGSISEADAHTQRVGERAYLVRFPENGEVPSLSELVGTDGGEE